MCGIIGILSKKQNAEVVLLEGIELLQNRGYDSAGIATLRNGDTEFLITKLSSDTLKKIDCIEALKQICPTKHLNSYAGIGHTRWATCGGKTDYNSHPHFDQNKRIVLCHNGTLDNFLEIRDQLIQDGIKLNSDTDSELIAQLIAQHLKQNPQCSAFEATKTVIAQKLSGQWGLVIMDNLNPESMIVARNGSPILIGLSNDTIYVASEKIAFEKYTSNYVNVYDGELVLACGSSFYAGLFAQNYFKKLKCFNSISVVEGSEFTIYDIPEEQGGIICISQSGETADIRSALDQAKEKGLFAIGVVNSVGSQIATSVDCGVYVNCGREVAVAATKSFTSQTIVLLMIALWVSKSKEDAKGITTNERFRKQMIDQLRSLPTSVGIILYSIQEQCQQTANKIATLKNIILLGKGACSAIAKEGALKLKELTYIHAEAFSAGELKHGPLALIDSENPKSTTILLIILDDEYLHDMKLALSEVHSRGAYTIVITNCLDKLPSEKVDMSIQLEHKDLLTPLLVVLPLQLTTYYVCKILDTNPDKPRNLAKCVTVK
ncbi:hypothetical protein IMG5_193830 [Ichthyophthirius multifiliis]|uniref:glutamine--fructose-6-phosphate transaminase (isomerizing) n=1 Tax=Ichthyophthirius multifiliis TaxID=5932 RepID=G0R4M3_ICHMU|nr:hypothetical protein IMG5_193830 [Ichthyophthirius multifiliis]EGR27583.1 hypothetical protein IMG5_193830 [Ichthyophthirius multifiliis]|eukprot:XP_004025035.1 hypothetical protein IMG5_193830 [Ichthyophthirius multifiliis]